jgi:hypothetical protein
VSPFAAGGAICGTDLDTHRWDTGPGLANRVGSWFSALGSGPAKGGMTPWVVIFLIFFGGSILTTLAAVLL